MTKKQIIWTIVILVVIVMIAIGGYKGYNYFENYLDKLENKKQQEIQILIKERDSIDRVYRLEIDSILETKNAINSYYEEYIREKRKADRLQRLIDNIVYDVYSRKQLDSFADNVKYK